MPTTGLKIRKFKDTGELGVAPERERRPIPMEVVDKVAVAIADYAACVPNSATSAQWVSCELCILHWHLYKIETVQN